MCAEPLAAFRISFPIAFPHAPLSRLRCRFASDVCASAPHVLALPVPAQPGPPEVTRAFARQQARTVLAQALAAALGCAAAQLAISDERGTRPRVRWCGPAATCPPALAGVGLSISHEAGWSLLAWCMHGPVGVDLAPVPADAAPSELTDLARLYLGPAGIPAKAPRPFAQAWAMHESRLKAAGKPLQEWHATLAARLAPFHAEALALPAALVSAPNTLCAAVAWLRRPA